MRPPTKRDPNCRPGWHGTRVRPNAPVLGVVLELDDVDAVIRAQHQLALCAAPHAMDMLHRQNRQDRSFAAFGCCLE